MEAISIDNLTKVYHSGKKALTNMSMSVQSGEIFTLLGQNGAGKSTLINTLTTYMTPTSGTVKILGRNLCKEPAFIRKQIACVAQKNSIDNHLSLMENMLFQSGLYKIDKKTAEKRISELIDSFDLREFANHRVVTYSGGIKRRLDIAMSMISHPKILFLDEPTVALDIESRKAVWESVKKIRKDYGTTIFMTTHYLEEAEALSDTICIIKDGHQLVQDSPNNLRKYTKQNLIKVLLNTSKDIEQFKNILSKKSFVNNINVIEDKVVVNVKDKTSGLPEINRILLSNNISYSSIGIIEPSLEDVFLTLTSDNEKEV